jgi:hypothetical protein
MRNDRTETSLRQAKTDQKTNAFRLFGKNIQHMRLWKKL